MLYSMLTSRTKVSKLLSVHGIPCQTILSLRRSPCSGKKFFSSSSERDRISNLSIEQWADEFKKATVGLASMDIQTISYQESAQRMRELLKTGLLRNTDLSQRPDRFFLAHRLLAQYAPKLGPGFWIRFTVHYNLCAGTVLGLGNADQVKQLDEWQEKGLLGCFSLTEKLAGVNSGLVVNTQAHWDPKTETFNLNSPGQGAAKNWISQGLVADKTVAIADLLVKDKSYGPHAFVMSLRDKGQVIPGVQLTDMGRKTVGNDLDNASIAFSNVKLPKSALLNRFADVEGDQYVQKVEGMPVFHMIGQRLFTGRVAVAQAALEFRKSLFEMTKGYADSKKCWSPTGEPLLSSIPQLKDIFVENQTSLSTLEAFVGKCEKELSACLNSGSLPSLQLVNAIAVAKVRRLLSGKQVTEGEQVKAVEDSIDFCHRLQNDVGSYALMAGTGFEQKDFLTCCKFAEGDSRILMQKMSRDKIKQYEKKPPTPEQVQADEEAKLAASLLECLAADAKTTGSKQEAWDKNWKLVYALADVIMKKTMKSYMSG